MKKAITLILASLTLAMMLVGCGKNSNSNETSTPNPAVVNNTAVSFTTSVTSIDRKEKQPLVIYHISDDEIELHFTSQGLETTEEIIFLAQSGDNVFNPAVQLRLEFSSGKTHPLFRAYTEKMDIKYTIDEYGGKMEAYIEGDTLICNIQHENIISAFKNVELWHIDTAQPLSFKGIITDDVSVIVEEVLEGVLPYEFRRSEYDDIYFKPDSDDFIVVSYKIPVRFWQLGWYLRYGVDWAYGTRGSSNFLESTATITYLLSFDDEKYLGTKVRLEYATIDEALLACYCADVDLVPAEKGLPNEKTDDAQVIADFFEESDWRFFGREEEEMDYEGSYYGHFDQFRYFNFKALDTIKEVKNLVPMRISENSDAIPYIPISSLKYTAGKTENTTLLSYCGNCEATSYSSKRTNEAGSSDIVLDIITKLPGDDKHFKPITDDYAYVITHNYTDKGDGEYMQEINLYSFNESGKLVQFVVRKYNSYFLKENFDPRSYFPDYSQEEWNYIVYDESGKVFYSDYLSLYGRDNLLYGGINEDDTQKDMLIQDLLMDGQNEGYYFSKP